MLLKENGANTSDEECGTKAGPSSVSNGEDSVSSPPPASFSTPSPSEAANAAAGNGNGNHGEFDEDSNAAKNGDFSLPPSDHDENSVPDINDVSSADTDVAVKNGGGDRVSSPEEETVSEITLPASNGTIVQENGNTEVNFKYFLQWHCLLFLLLIFVLSIMYDRGSIENYLLLDFFNYEGGRPIDFKC